MGVMSLAVNPYATYGNPVSAEAFVGRRAELRQLRSRIIDAAEAAPVSIVGPPRIGKSSLARLVHDRYVTGVSRAGMTFVPVWLTVSGRDSEQSLFRELAAQTRNWITDHGGWTSRLEEPFTALASSTTWDQMRERVLESFRVVRQHGYQVVAVLDEFDGARMVFRRAAPFELLRALASEAKFGVALITTSRRELPEIVVRSTAEVSNFPQIFGNPLILGCFSDPELAELAGRSPYAPQDLWPALRGWLWEETGGQPFLASALLSTVHDHLAGPAIPTGEALVELLTGSATMCGRLFVEYYDRLLDLLREEKRLTLLLEVLFGPQLRARPVDADRLDREGIIRPTHEGWAGFSANFHEYLGLLERNVDHWPLWHRTETKLRLSLTTALEIVYGESWTSVVADSQGKLVRDCEQRQRHARTAFGQITGHQDDNVLDYAYPDELTSIIMVHWSQLEPLFGRTKDEWNSRLTVAAQLRTPMAHNRPSPPVLAEQFRQVCTDLLEWLP